MLYKYIQNGVGGAFLSDLHQFSKSLIPEHLLYFPGLGVIDRIL